MYLLTAINLELIFFSLHLNRTVHHCQQLSATEVSTMQRNPPRSLDFERPAAAKTDTLTVLRGQK